MTVTHARIQPFTKADMAESHNVVLESATPADAGLLANLLELYIHDLSAAFPSVQLGADGRFGYPKLALYWSEPEQRFPFLIRCDGHIAGFVLATRGSPVTEDPSVLDVAEFFVMRRYRGAGVGRGAARLLWQRFPGRWTVRVSEGNAPAIPFWARVTAEASRDGVTELRRDGSPHAWRVFSFEVAPHRAFLDSCDVIDWRAEPIRELVAALSAGMSRVALIRTLFEWVRDNVSHTGDAGQGVITLRASDVLRERTGLCYAKSHLLVALLRASGIPSGFCYQRLRADDSGTAFVLHGLVGVQMPDGTYKRIDPRGNKPGIHAQFHPDHDALAFAVQHEGEADLPGVFARPLPEVVTALAAASHWPMGNSDLPDVAPERWPSAVATWCSRIRKGAL